MRSPTSISKRSRARRSAAKLLSKDEGSGIADQSHKVLCGDQILRLGLTLLNHQTRIAPTTPPRHRHA
jgi:hypothetical protein